jgi:hypothetical protein
MSENRTDMSVSSPTKIFLDTCVFDWFIDDLRGATLLAQFQTGKLQAVVFPEVSKEIHDIPERKADRRERLMAILRPFFPLQRTLVPVSGLARSGAAVSARRGAVELREKLRAVGFRKLDIIHLMNAHYSECRIFLTNDREDIIRRKALLEPWLGFEVLRPSELLDRLETSGRV